MERFRAEIAYHAAYNYLSLKGVLAERWAHGPLFGSFADQGNQVTLTPEDGFKKDRVDGIYGIRASSFDRECVSDKNRTYEETNQWLRDVVEVLRPKVVTRMTSHWFALYPLSNQDAAEAATRRLKLHYYSKEQIGLLEPEGYTSKFAAVSGLSMKNDKHLSVDMGVVGPPHRGTLFGLADDDRDSRWWMGLKISLVRQNPDGINPALEAIGDLITEGSKEYERLVMQGFGSIF